MGGTRELTGVRFDFNHNFQQDIALESTGPTAVSAGDLLIEFGFISIFQLGTVMDGGGDTDPDDDPDGDGGSQPPFFGPGATFTGFFSTDLPAYNGNPGENVYRQTFSESYSNSWDYGVGDSAVLDAVTGTGSLETVLGGFAEIQFNWVNAPGWPAPGGFFPNYPNDATVWAGWDQLRHFGSLSVTYSYNVIPAPGMLALTGAMGLVATRRRR